MGGSESKHPSTETEKLNSSHQATDTDEDHTPVVNRRLKHLVDPRSPTDGVSRTPIVHADKAEPEEPTSPVLKINTRITQNVTDAPDPRSPSSNVARTPQPFKFSDPRSPTDGVTRTPHIRHVQESGDPRSPTPGVERASFNPEETEVEAKQEHKSSFECLVDDPKPEENLNSSNSNEGALKMDDVVTELEMSEDDSLKTQLIAPSTAAEPGLKQIYTPQYEAELSAMVKKQIIYCDADEERTDDADDAPCLSTEAAAEHKTKAHKKSLKAKVQQKFHGGSPRSPLSTRNLLSDSPSLHMHSGKSSVSYVDKRRRHTVGVTPTRLVGRYEQMPIDKENV